MDPNTQDQMRHWGDVAVDWLPRIIAAIIILVVAHFLAIGVKWALAKLVDRAPGAARHNQGKGPNETVGHQLGQVGYWLVLLLGLIAALNALQLSGVVEPLNAMLTNFLSYVPHIVGAAVILFVGSLVAILARNLVEAALQAANIDHWLDKLKLRGLAGRGGLAKAVGTIVFVLIIIPVAIAALQTLQIEAISRPAIEVLSTVLSAVPNVLAAAIILLIGFGIGSWVKSILESVLPSLGLDSMLGRLGILAGSASRAPVSSATVTAGGVAPPSAAAAASTLTPSSLLGTLAMVAIVLFSATEAARVLGFEAIALMTTQIIDLFGRVLFGAVVIAAGVLIANALSSAVKRSGQGEGFAAVIVRWAVIALATAMGLRFMGLANEIVTLAFGLILGSAAVAAAIAFGLGGREPAKKLLEKVSEQASSPPPPTM